MISEEEKELVREKTDLLQLIGETVNLKRSGSTYSGCCPFHNDKSPSFHVNPEKGFWKCFGCQKSGDVFSFVMEKEHVEFPDAIRYLAERAQIELHEDAQIDPDSPKKKRLYELLEETEKYYSKCLMRGQGKGFQHAREYFSGRGFNSEVSQRWNLGYAPGYGLLAKHLKDLGYTQRECEAANVLVSNGKDRFYNRVMFPIHDEMGRCIGFGGRVLGDGKPKYLNTSDTMVFHKKKHMYAYDKARETIVSEGCAIVVEGYTDVISMHEAGITNVVAVLGTALTLEHIKLLSRFSKKIIFMFDGDEAGKKAAKRSLQFMKDTQADLRCVILPDNLDPADFIAQRGVEELKAHLDASDPLIDFVFEIILSEYDLDIPGQKVKAFDELSSLLSVFKDSILLDQYAQKLANAFDVDVSKAEKSIVQAKPSITSQASYSYTKAESKPQPQPYTQTQPQPEVQVDTIAYSQVDDYERYDYASDYDFSDSQDMAQYDYVSTSADNIYYDNVDVQPKVETSYSQEDKDQLVCERELLSFFARYPDVCKGLRSSLENIEWIDQNHKDMCMAMLATPDNSDTASVVDAAKNVCANAEEILNSGKIVSDQTRGKNEKIQFILVNLELQMTRRRIRERNKLVSHVANNEELKTIQNEVKTLSEHRDRLMEILTKI